MNFNHKVVCSSIIGTAAQLATSRNANPIAQSLIKTHRKTSMIIAFFSNNHGHNREITPYRFAIVTPNLQRQHLVAIEAS
ncbi:MULTISPECIES: hypothetical protein [unclassified Beijerinckia]|uniref:hypothetical protein n=1 Tax=unclassified Beijerinckia TaxID=2638183 RepID=UPI000B894261|nr:MULTISPECIES: hypothetical protein [unclassified Beijerinckia]MDH7797594.1 hypothetical protein [Beijerinckia sp. GAS462]